MLEHGIVTGDVPPMRAAPYQIPEKWREYVRKEIGTLMEMGVLVPSTSPWGSPIVPVAKQDGSVRVCGVFRRLNKVTAHDQYHVPLVSEIVGRIGKARYLSKLDLNKGFHQVRLTEQARCKTAM